jgi:hypothetical protein
MRVVLVGVDVALIFACSSLLLLLLLASTTPLLLIALRLLLRLRLLLLRWSLLLLPGRSWLLLLTVGRVGTLALHRREFVRAAIEWSIGAFVLLGDGSSNVCKCEHLAKVRALHEKLRNRIPFGGKGGEQYEPLKGFCNREII